MSIQTEINRLNTAKINILKSIKNKGVDTSSAETLSDVPTLIDNIQTGITPTGTLDITANGTYDVTNYASANVNVASSGGKYQGFSAVFFCTSSSGTVQADGLLIPIELGKKYRINLGIDNPISFETECIVSEDVLAIGSTEYGFMYSPDYAMAIFPSDHFVQVTTLGGMGIGYVFMSIEEV